MRHVKSYQLRAVVAATLVAATVSGVAAQSADGPWMIRVRALNLDSANNDSTGLDLSINNKVMPEIDGSYYFTPELAAELVLTYPQRHHLRAGNTRIGSLKHLPPTLTLQYHWTQLGSFVPYAGVGVNYTRFSNVRFDPAVQSALQPSIERSSVGMAGQLGFDVMLSSTWALNVDVKKLQLRTDVRSAGAKVGEFKVDPWLVGAGLGWRF